MLGRGLGLSRVITARKQGREGYAASGGER